MDKEYYIVEYRFPVEIMEADNVKDAAMKAASVCERIYGFRPSDWYARVFRYTSGKDVVGPVEEYFFNPQGERSRLIDQNHAKHQEMIDNGETDSSSD